MTFQQPQAAVFQVYRWCNPPTRGMATSLGRAAFLRSYGSWGGLSHTENLVRVKFVDVVHSHCYTLRFPCATQSFFCLPSFVPGFKAVCSFRRRSSPCATRS